MPEDILDRKTGLRYGDLSNIAREFGLSLNHVRLVARRERQGSAALELALAERRAERAREAAQRMDAIA